MSLPKMSPELTTIVNALDNTFGEDQRRIAEIGLKLVATLIQKNIDYGSSVWKPPALKPTMDSGDAILVRMSDKVSRIGTLQKQAAQHKSETLDDTVMDLAGYAILWLARPTGEQNEE